MNYYIIVYRGECLHDNIVTMSHTRIQEEHADQLEAFKSYYPTPRFTVRVFTEV